MKVKRIILQSLIVILLIVYVFQLVSENKGSVKKVTLDGEPDKLIVESATNGKVVLTKKDDVWYLGENMQYDTLSSEVNILTSALSSYSVLQTVSKGGDEVLYGLDDDAKISVTAYQNGNVICQVDVGKDASTARQSYIRMAGEKDILLISDSWNSVFNITGDDVRVRNVYNFSTEDITDAALINGDAGVLMMKRTDDGIWFGNNETMTDNAISSWISTISILNAAGWLPDDWQPSVEPVGLITFKMNGETITDSIYPVEGSDDKYIGTSSACPYAFYMSSYTAEKFLRTVDDFAE